MRKLFSSLAVCPAPLAPMWKTRGAERRRAAGRARSSASAEPPAMIGQRALLGRGRAAGDAGVEELDAAFARARACEPTVELGAAVLRSTTTCPGRQCSRMPSSPSTTASTTGLSGSESRTTSLAVDDAAIDAARRCRRRRPRGGVQVVAEEPVARRRRSGRRSGRPCCRGRRSRPVVPLPSFPSRGGSTSALPAAQHIARVPGCLTGRCSRRRP